MTFIRSKVVTTTNTMCYITIDNNGININLTLSCKYKYEEKNFFIENYVKVFP